MAMLLYSCIMLYLRAIGCEALDETGKLAQEVGESPPVKQARAPCMFQRLSVKVNGNINKDYKANMDGCRWFGLPDTPCSE